jgi:hypothetical protein
MSKQKLLEEFGQACKETADFIEHASYNGGMHMEARMKLIENQMDALFWFVDKLIKALPDDEILAEPSDNTGK